MDNKKVYIETTVPILSGCQQSHSQYLSTTHNPINNNVRLHEPPIRYIHEHTHKVEVCFCVVS